VNIPITIGLTLAELKNRNEIDFLFLIDFMADPTKWQVQSSYEHYLCDPPPPPALSFSA